MTVVIASLTLSDEDVDALGWRPFIPHVTTARLRREPTTCIDPAAQTDRDALARTFWALLGDLGSDVLLDEVDGPWAASTSVPRENLTP